jgi:hypothetical protein
MMSVKCVVSCRDANGTPSLFVCTVAVSQEQYAASEHYDLAAEKAEQEGYEDAGLVYDEDDGPRFLFAYCTGERWRMRDALEKVHALFVKMTKRGWFDQMCGDFNPDEINAACNAVEEALKGPAPKGLLKLPWKRSARACTAAPRLAALLIFPSAASLAWRFCRSVASICSRSTPPRSGGREAVQRRPPPAADSDSMDAAAVGCGGRQGGVARGAGTARARRVA